MSDRPVMVVDATLRHEVDDPESLELLLEDGDVRQAPAEADAELEGAPGIDPLGL